MFSISLPSALNHCQTLLRWLTDGLVPLSPVLSGRDSAVPVMVLCLPVKGARMDVSVLGFAFPHTALERKLSCPFRNTLAMNPTGSVRVPEGTSWSCTDGKNSTDLKGEQKIISGTCEDPSNGLTWFHNDLFGCLPWWFFFWRGRVYGKIRHSYDFLGRLKHG